MSYTYSKIATVEVGSSGVGTMEFLAIPQNYTDLVLKLSVRSDTAGTSRTMDIRLNGDSSSVYSARWVYGYASGTASSSNSAASTIYSGLYGGSAYTGSTFGNIEIYIPNYSSDKYKSISSDSVSENNSTTNYVGFWAGLYPSSKPITSITVVGSLNFVQYSTATLYGIKAEV